MEITTGYENVLCGHGPCKKGSLSLAIYKRLIAACEYWTDRGGDNLDLEDLTAQIIHNAQGELLIAVTRFSKDVFPA